MSDWDRRFMDLAERVASWSKDPSTQVGAIITDSKNRIVSTGFNGFARGIEDDLNIPRETKLMRMIHAEENALLFARCSVEGFSLYVTRPPCANCASKIIQAGIKRVIYPNPPFEFLERWSEHIKESLGMFKQVNIKVTML